VEWKKFIMEKFLDYVGNEIYLDDTVIIPFGKTMLIHGTVVGFTKKMVKVNIIRPAYADSVWGWKYPKILHSPKSLVVWRKN
jgi:hypothetical protein